MTRLRLHVLPEVDHHGRPHSSPYVRLLRPLTHPSVAPHLSVRFARDCQGEPADAVVLDRLWGPWLTSGGARALVQRSRDAGARLLYVMDDNLLDLGADRGDWPTPDHVAIMEYLLAAADGVLVSTEPLRQRLARFNANMVTVPNALDERLVVRRPVPAPPSPFGADGPVVIGLMGTLTHDRDLMLILPALRDIARRHGRGVRIECIGVVEHAATRAQLAGLPIDFIAPPPDEAEYPLFMLWFTSRIHWDVALAPLRDTPFTRCKSDLKFLDYAAIGAAGLYSAVTPYATGVRHAETGWLVPNEPDAWAEALDRLVTDAALRRHLAAGADTELFAHRVLARRAPDWLQAFQRLLAAAPVPATTEPAHVPMEVAP